MIAVAALRSNCGIADCFVDEREFHTLFSSRSHRLPYRQQGFADFIVAGFEDACLAAGFGYEDFPVAQQALIYASSRKSVGE